MERFIKGAETYNIMDEPTNLEERVKILQDRERRLRNILDEGNPFIEASLDGRIIDANLPAHTQFRDVLRTGSIVPLFNTTIGEYWPTVTALKPGQDVILSSESKGKPYNLKTLMVQDNGDGQKIRVYGNEATTAKIEYLTKLSTRQEFDEKGAFFYQQMMREKDAFSIILFDVDHFKKINDTYGHPGGDYTLIELAKRIKAPARITDVCARLGGEEFGVLMKGDKDNALHVASKIRESSQSEDFVFDGKRFQVTVSGGIATLPQDDMMRNNSFEKLYALADRRLYLAKQNGRNQIKCD